MISKYHYVFRQFISTPLMLEILIYGILIVIVFGSYTQRFFYGLVLYLKPYLKVDKQNAKSGEVKHN